METKAASLQFGVHAMTVGKWRRRFLDRRVEGLRDEPRPGAPRTIDDERIEAVITRTLESQPDEATHGSSRGMAHDGGLAVSTVQRIWRAFGLKPHRQETFKLSTDPDFVAKVHDVVGLYMAPPEHALVLCVDEKSQIQALDRSQAVFRCGPASRSGAATTTPGMGRPRCSPPSISPPARLSASAIRVIGQKNSAGSSMRSKPACRAICHAQDRADPRLAGEASALGRASDPNQQFLAEPGRALLCKQIRRGVHRSVEELEAAITAILDKHNTVPKPFRWVKSADDILAAIERFCLYNTSPT